MSSDKINNDLDEDDNKYVPYPNLDWFSVRLSLEGLTEDERLNGLTDLQEELDARKYLRNCQVNWDAKIQLIIAEIETQSLDPKSASLAAYDDFFESVVGTIHFSSEEGIRVNILDAKGI